MSESKSGADDGGVLSVAGELVAGAGAELGEAGGAVAVTVFSPTEVARLHQCQFGPWRRPFELPNGLPMRMHPFTCPNRGDGNHFDNGSDLGALIPTVRGWICQSCDYTQGWAHDSMKAAPPVLPEQKAREAGAP